MKNDGNRVQEPPKHRARKRFGQNFLRDRRVVERIVDTLAPGPGQHVLEIGPGQGALTEQILASGARVDAIELDRDLSAGLQALFARHDNATLHQADILRFNIADLAPDTGTLRIIGNLPYNISTPCLFHLFESQSLIRDMLFMLQREVVDRLAAAPGDTDYGRLSIMAQYHCRVEPLFDVPPSAFSPQPRVTSSIVRLVPHASPPWPARDHQALQLLVRTAFSRRRKTLKNAVKGLISEQALQDCGLDAGQRPETLSIADFVTLSNALSESSDPSAGSTGDPANAKNG